MRKGILLFLIAICCLTLNAQNRTINGNVTSVTDKLSLPGVNVSVKESGVGTVTNTEGNYTLEIKPTDKTLVFSFIGMKTKEVVIGASDKIDVVMEEDAMGLDEVVVTAMGIKKKKKALGYAVQNVKSDKLLEGNQSNIATSLQGKVAGVTVSSAGGSPGGSNIIMIRGGSSLSGNNQPLYIVDGLPIDNSTNSSSEVASANRATDINPEDIESISVLKGATAAALYGIQAAEGAIVITTKKGKAGSEKINFSSTFSFDKVLGTPDQQSMYGQGIHDYDSNGNLLGYDQNPKTHLFSWGEKIPAGTPVYDNISDLYSQAVTKKYNINYSAGTERSTYFASASYLDQGGVIDGTSHEKINLTFNGTSKFRKNLTVGVNAKYIHSETESNVQGTSTGSSFANLLKYPRTVNAKDYKNADGTQKIFMTSAEEQEFDNPYWSMANSPNTNEMDRLIGQFNLNYKPFKFLTVSYRLGTDFYSQFDKRVTAKGSLVEKRKNGRLRQFERVNSAVNSNLLVMFNKKVLEDFSVDVTLGHSVDNKKVRVTYSGGDKFEADGIYSVSNILQENQILSESKSRKRLVGVFGEAKLGWKDIAFLNFTGRNDWSSTLPKEERSFFYPSVGTSVVFTDLLKEFDFDITSSNFLSYLKLRATYAMVGKDAPPLASASYLVLLDKHYVPVSEGYTWSSNQAGNPDLKPEFTKSYEFGIDARFLENRITLDLTYYNSISDEQLLNVRLPPAAGAYIAQLNGGSVRNKGFEALASFDIMPRESEFQWNMTMNFAKAESTVEDLPGELVEVNNSQSWTWNSTALGAAVLDGYLFGLKGKRPLKNDKGETIINDKGYYSLDEDIYDNVNRMPDWTLGITNNFSYKGFNLSFLFDMSIGGDIYNATKAAMTYYGLSDETANRSTTETIVLEGVKADGTKNTTPILKDQKYYQDYYSQNSENFIEDATFMKLRYVTLSYDLPKSLLKKVNIDKLQLFVTGRNLLMFTDYSGVDPEIATFGASVSGSGAIGLDNLSTPNTKGFDLGIKINF